MDDLQTKIEDTALEKTTLEKNYPLMCFGKEFLGAKRELSYFRNATNKLKTINDNPKDFISNHFIELRNDADIERELAKKKIDDRFDKIIQELSNLEEDCKSLEIEADHDENIKQFEIDLKLLYEDINIPEVDTKKWHRIKTEAAKKTTETNAFIENYKNFLLNNQSLGISSIQNDLETLFDKELIEKKKVLAIEKGFPLTKYFQFSIEYFDDIKEENAELCSKTFYFGDSAWELRFRNKNGFLDVYLHLDNYFDFEYVNTSFIFELLNVEFDDQLSECMEANFEDGDGIGFTLTDINDLFEMGYYDKDNNCINCMIEITIKAIKERKRKGEKTSESSSEENSSDENSSDENSSEKNSSDDDN